MASYCSSDRLDVLFEENNQSARQTVPNTFIIFYKQIYSIMYYYILLIWIQTNIQY